MKEEDLISQESLDEMSAGIVAEIDEAVTRADQDPYPEPEDCLKGVYYDK
jgi:TPP-dependent pyruvate/acetoin dehydrogenase alpha subunit